MIIRTCDWCKEAPLYSFAVPSTISDESTTIEFCASHTETGLAVMRDHTISCVYPTEVLFTVVDA